MMHGPVLERHIITTHEAIRVVVQKLGLGLGVLLVLDGASLGHGPNAFAWLHVVSDNQQQPKYEHTLFHGNSLANNRKVVVACAKSRSAIAGPLTKVHGRYGMRRGRCPDHEV